MFTKKGMYMEFHTNGNEDFSFDIEFPSLNRTIKIRIQLIHKYDLKNVDNMNENDLV